MLEHLLGGNSQRYSESGADGIKLVLPSRTRGSVTELPICLSFLVGCQSPVCFLLVTIMTEFITMLSCDKLLHPFCICIVI